MENSQTIGLYITYVDKEGPFLKVWGQMEKTNAIYVEQFLLNTTLQFDQGFGKLPVESLEVGTLVCAKYKDNKYYRARITNVAYIRDFFVEVSFLDYGNKDIVPCDNVRSVQNFPPSFISIPPLANGFIFAEAHCPGGGEWTEAIFDNIAKEIRYQDVQCKLLAQATQYYLVKLYINSTDIGALFIGRGLMQPISLQAQQAVLLSMSMQKRHSVPSAAAPTPEINTYKACQLEPGAQYPVYVSYVNDGPTLFSVQLKQTEDILVKLMKDINSIDLRPLEDMPLPGTICLARCQEDGNICRAVVTNEVDQQFKVFYVDFGNQEVVPIESLYTIPFKYVLPKVMVVRFGLAGVEKSTVTPEMSCAFKDFVDNRLLHLKVLPSATRTSVQKCELWDPKTKTSALDVLNRAARHAYPDPLALNRGTSQPVKVSFVYSCNRFYVQLVSKEAELIKLMNDLQASCPNDDPMDPADIRAGLPCCALFEADQLWYRSEIVDIVDGVHVKVRYIDYGNEEVVPITQLRMVEGELLTVLRPQAIECCLNGYQNMEPDLERDGFLEELILEQTFTMKVAEMVGRKALVELIDSANYNVASLLLDKMAAAKSQVSPLLVQAGNRIEHRKAQAGPRGDGGGPREKAGGRPQARENKGWNNRNEKPNEKSWRQENKDRETNRNFERDTNSNEDASQSTWRQDNKGFNRNRDERNDRFNRDNDRFSRGGDRFGRDGSDRPGKFGRDDNRPDRYGGRDGNRNASDWKANDNAANGSEDGWEETTPVPPTVAVSDGGDDRWNDSGHVSAGFQKGPRNRDDRGGHRGGRFNKGGDRPPRRDGDSKPGFKKRTDFRKDGSEISSSGSEKSFQRGPRTSSRNDRGDRRFNKRDQNSSFHSPPVDNSWTVSSVATSINAAPADAVFTLYDVVGTESKVVVSWFHNPSNFYCQLVDTQTAFKTMMEDMQQFYKDRPAEPPAAVGAPVVGLFPEDNVLYRAQVLEVAGGAYKVFYVDFGNVSSISKVWPIERRFMNLPAQAMCCGLAGLAPPGDEWPGAESYRKYFEREPLTARFVNRDYENKSYVYLLDGADDVGQLLVQNGLARAEMPEPQVEVSLLLGQQFRVVVKSVNNLSDIIVALECGVALGCQMHNLDTASETFEDVLKGYLEQTVITYVDNVLEDNRLEVTFYDNDGNKLTILNPDEGAFDVVDPLCPYLILSSTLSGYISHVDENSVYVQPSEYSDQIVMYLEKLFEFYDGQKETDLIVPEEEMLYAVKSNDENWYRARVMNFDDEKATVCYIDYGNSESVPFVNLRELDGQFVVPNMMCVKILVGVPTASLLDQNVALSVHYGESGWEGTVHDQNPAMTQPVSEPEVLSEPSAPISEQTDELENVVYEPPQEETPTVAADVPASAGADPPPPAERKGVPVVVSHTDSPNEFYVQLGEALAAIDELQARLQAEAPGMPVLENVTAGVLCAAPYSLDSQWYRAEVLDADADITTVRFVDYGNTDVISNETTQIKTLPPELLSLAVYATRCSLKAKPVEEEWSAAALDHFERLAAAGSVSVEFQDQDEKTHYVELYADGRDVREELIGRNVALPAELVGDNKSNCFISHLSSPSEFWIQLESCVDDLEWIAEQLAGAEGFPELEDLAPGTLCAALFPDDEMWYRARILSNTVAGLELLFIDYGNSCTSSSLRQLSEDLVVTPPLAQKCSLQRPSGIPYWTPQACNKFNELSADGQTIFTVKKINTGETAVVELFVNGEDIVPKLLPETVSGTVEDCVSLEQFSVEKPDGKVENCKLETMPGMVWDGSSIQKFAETNKEGLKFEIEFIDDTTVRLYLNGNDIRPSLGGVKSSTLNLSPSKEIKSVSSDEIVDHIADGDNSQTVEDQNDSNFCSTDVSSEPTSEQEHQKIVTPDSAIEDKGEIEIKESGSKSPVKDDIPVKIKTTSEQEQQKIVTPDSAIEDKGEIEIRSKSPVKDDIPVEIKTKETEELSTVNTMSNTNESEAKPSSRPASRHSLNHDEKIVPGVVSRPQTPVDELPDGKEEKCTDQNDSLFESFSVSMLGAITGVLDQLETESQNVFDNTNQEEVVFEQIPLEENPDEEKTTSAKSSSSTDSLSDSIKDILIKTVMSALNQKELKAECFKSDKFEENAKLEKPKISNNYENISQETVHDEKLSQDKIEESKNDLFELVNTALTNALESALDYKDNSDISSIKQFNREEKHVPEFFSLQQTVFGEILNEETDNITETIADSKNPFVLLTTDFETTIIKEKTDIKCINDMPGVLLKLTFEEQTGDKNVNIEEIININETLSDSFIGDSETTDTDIPLSKMSLESRQTSSQDDRTVSLISISSLETEPDEENKSVNSDIVEHDLNSSVPQSVTHPEYICEDWIDSILEIIFQTEDMNIDSEVIPDDLIIPHEELFEVTQTTESDTSDKVDYYKKLEEKVVPGFLCGVQFPEPPELNDKKPEPDANDRVEECLNLILSRVIENTANKEAKSQPPTSSENDHQEQVYQEVIISRVFTRLEVVPEEEAEDMELTSPKLKRIPQNRLAFNPEERIVPGFFVTPLEDSSDGQK